jgi:hypothetical protein
MTKSLFPLTIFLASFLLFLSEPIAARQLLPIFGGSAAVWMTCLVFFQIALLLGYSYAHLLARSRSSRWTSIHGALVCLASASALAWALGLLHPHALHDQPALAIFESLTLTIGLPFLALASTSPLLQIWFQRVDGKGMPYRFFALSNLGSFLALFVYPTLIEPNVTLSLQRTLWAAGISVFAVLSLVINWRVRKSGLSFRSHDKQSAPPTSEPLIPLRSRILWFLLPMVAAMQLSAVTAYITSNIAAIPLLWILPLAVYLLTFILAFQFPQLVRFRGLTLRLLAVMLAALGWFLSHANVDLPIGLTIGFFLAEAFLACLFCHTETYALRPETSAQATSFYLTLSAGGAAGSFLIGIAFPLLFSGNYDLAITFFFTALLALAIVWQFGWLPRLVLATGAALLLFLVFALRSAYQHNTLFATRNFYGSLRVQQSVTEHGDPIRTLVNGSIEHGTQIFSPDLIRIPTTYYATDSGAGLALLNCCVNHPKYVGVVGLGAGTLAAYGRLGDNFRFYEINPAVLPIAQNLFTWLRDSPAQLTFVEGDARASLAAEPPQHFDVLLVDAFSGDAIPLHLLTTQAFALYLRHLAPSGILAFHVSNRYVDLAPQIALLATTAHLQARIVSSPEDKQSGTFKSTWVLIPTNPIFLSQPTLASRSTPIRAIPNLRVWTDDYSSLLPLVHW